MFSLVDLNSKAEYSERDADVGFFHLVSCTLEIRDSGTLSADGTTARDRATRERKSGQRGARMVRNFAIEKAIRARHLVDLCDR